MSNHWKVICSERPPEGPHFSQSSQPNGFSEDKSLTDTNISFLLLVAFHTTHTLIQGWTSLLLPYLELSCEPDTGDEKTTDLSQSSKQGWGQWPWQVTSPRAPKIGVKGKDRTGLQARASYGPFTISVTLGYVLQLIREQRFSFSGLWRFSWDHWYKLPCTVSWAL